MDLLWSIGSCHRDIADNFDFSKSAQGIEKLNTGFYVAHPTPSVIKLLSRAFVVCSNGHLTGDQPALNEVILTDLQKASKSSVAKPKTDKLPARGSLGYSYGFFDGCLFANGCIFFKHLCANVTGAPRGVAPAIGKKYHRNDPVLVHANFLVGKKEKIKHLVKYGLWDDRCIAKWKQPLELPEGKKG